jgi:hypothetical protein
MKTEFEEMGRFSGLGDTGCHSLPYLKNFRPENFSLTKVRKIRYFVFLENHVSLVMVTL